MVEEMGVLPDRSKTLIDDSAPSRAVLALAAGTVIGVGVRLSPRAAVALVVIALALLVYAVVTRHVGLDPAWFRLASIASLLFGAALFVSWTVLSVYRSPATDWFILAPAIVVVIALAVGLFAFPDASRYLYPLFLTAFFLSQMLALASVSAIDVTYFQTEGAKVLLAGANPFAVLFPDLFTGPGGGEPLYGSGVSVNGILQFGFPYPPLSLLLIVPFQALFQDYRVGIALAYVATAWLISRLGEPEVSRRMSVLSLLVAPVTIVNVVGFTEPLVVLLGVGIIAMHKHRQRLSPYVLGGFLSIKQYTVIALPIFLLLEPRPWHLWKAVRTLTLATAVLAVTTLPFLLWNSEALIRSVYVLQFRQPLRGDAITFTAQYIAPYVQLPNVLLAALPIGGAIVAIAVSLRYAPTGLQGYALGSALTFVMFFLLAKQPSMPNYYAVVIAFCFSAAATFVPQLSPVGEDEQEGIETPLASEGT